MLFKQWNNLAEPRHQLDATQLVQNSAFLQDLAIPEVKFPDINLSMYKRVVFIPKLMEPLFPKDLLQIRLLGDISTCLKLDLNSDTISSQQHLNEYTDSDDVIYDKESTQQTTFISQIKAFNKSLLISVEENFLKMSPIFSNVIADQLIQHLMTEGSQISEFYVFGTSDRLIEMKKLTSDECSLVAPEFITGFVGSVLTQLITKEVANFRCLIAPSEGPTGFEKITYDILEDLTHATKESLSLDNDKYLKTSKRLWKVQSTAIGAQSGMYI